MSRSRFSLTKSSGGSNPSSSAPDELLWTDSNGQVGAYKAKTDSDGEFKSNDRGSKIRSEETGSWRVFQGGKQTGQYRGDWKPKEQPTLWDRLTKKEEVK